MRFLFVVHKNEEKAEQNSVLFHRLTLKERGLRPNGYFPLMRQPLYPKCLPALYFLRLHAAVQSVDFLSVYGLVRTDFHIIDLAFFETRYGL